MKISLKRARRVESELHQWILHRCDYLAQVREISLFTPDLAIHLGDRGVWLWEQMESVEAMVRLWGNLKGRIQIAMAGSELAQLQSRLEVNQILRAQLYEPHGQGEPLDASAIALVLNQAKKLTAENSPKHVSSVQLDSILHEKDMQRVRQKLLHLRDTQDDIQDQIAQQMALEEIDLSGEEVSLLIQHDLLAS